MSFVNDIKNKVTGTTNTQLRNGILSMLRSWLTKNFGSDMGKFIELKIWLFAMTVPDMRHGKFTLDYFIGPENAPQAKDEHLYEYLERMKKYYPAYIIDKMGPEEVPKDMQNEIVKVLPAPYINHTEKNVLAILTHKPAIPVKERHHKGVHQIQMPIESIVATGDFVGVADPDKRRKYNKSIIIDMTLVNGQVVRKVI